MIDVGTATAAVASRQAGWIATMEPWRSLGFREAALARFLRRSAVADAAGGVLLATANAKRGGVLGLVCVQPGVLLGNFVALLAVKPEAGGRGVGRALMEAVERNTFATRRWLFVSVDADNRGARVFYRKLGFTQVGRLPDLVQRGRTEFLLRKPAPLAVAAKASPRRG